MMTIIFDECNRARSRQLIKGTAAKCWTSGTDVMIFKIFSQKISGAKTGDFDSNYSYLGRKKHHNMINTLTPGWRRHRNFYLNVGTYTFIGYIGISA
jgi:hypothetical protein